MIPVDEIAMRPTLSFLSPQDKERIHRAAIKILDDIGMKIFQDEALALLQDAGCRVAEDRMVKIPGDLVQQCVESASSNIPIYDREGKEVMNLGGYRSYFGTGSDLIYALDSKTGQRHSCVLEDVSRAAKVADALPNIDFIMIVILDEIIDQVRRLYRGIPVDDEMLALDVIKTVGADGNFLTQMHTVQHLRSTQWQPKLISRVGYEKWQSSGRTSLLDRGREKLQQILQEHQPVPIPDDQARRIQKWVDRFK